MPTFLRRDSIRLLEGSLQCLHLGIVGLGTPRVDSVRARVSEFCAEIGLIGAAAELAVSACYVQIRGASVLLTEGGGYKSAGKILDEFIGELTAPSPALEALLRGVDEPSTHVGLLEKSCRKFRLLATMRAGGLHAAHGPSREACVSVASDVSSFLVLLSRSARISPYLRAIPEPPYIVDEPSTLLTEIQRRVDRAPSLQEQGRLALELFLVLPELPVDMPDWLDAFERVAVAPEKADVTYLLKTLENATPISFRKSRQGGQPTAVVVDPSNPSAIPIAPHYLRTEFTKTPDRFFADVANANGRLADSILDLPPETFVKELFAIGFERSGILASAQQLTPHQSWPFIVASLAVQGCPGPFWFLVRRTTDLAQLVAQLQRASAVARPYIAKRVNGCLPGILAIRDRSTVPRSGEWKSLLEYGEAIEENRASLERRITLSASTDKRLSPALEGAVASLARTDDAVGPVLLTLLDKRSGASAETLSYWSRILSETAAQQDDASGLLAVLRNAGCGGAHSAAKKALRYLDFVAYGPVVAAT